MTATATVLLGLLLAGCSKKEATPGPTTGTAGEPEAAPPPRREVPASAAPAEGCVEGALCEVEGLSLTVTAISDSRCPINARCIQAGDAAVTFTLAGTEAPETLHTNEMTGAQQLPLPDGRALVLAAVEPYPGRGAPDAIRRASFRITAPGEPDAAPR